MTTKLFLDTRATGDAPAPLKLAICKYGKTAYVPLGMKIPPHQWDKRAQRVINHPNTMMMNNVIAGEKFKIERKLIELLESGKLLGLSPTQIKALLTKPEKEEDVTLGRVFREFVDEKTGRTREIYEATWVQLERFAKPFSVHLTEVTPKWLASFDRALQRHSPSRNARNIHLRNIRAVFNYAIDNEYTTYYPFRKFKTKNEPTRKRSFDANTILKIFTAETSPYERKFQVAFELSFYLIGINVVDLCDIDINNGRVEYKRRKTKKLYSIKLEDEAKRCIDEIRGTKHTIFALDHYKSSINFNHELNKVLKRIAEREGLPPFTSYWARHSWATIAYKIGVPKDTISLALGHSFGCRITDIYVDYSLDAVDDANRKVIDYLNGLRETQL